MGLSKSHEPNKGSVRTLGNYSFRWTEDHVTKEKTAPLRHRYDELGAATANRILEMHQHEQDTRKQKGQPQSKLDMFTKLKDNHDKDETLSNLWTQVNTVPEWVDWEQLESAQRFFYRYAMGNIIGFALQGFIGENSASASVVEVLLRTGGFSTRSLRRRLLETFQFLLEVTHSLPFIKPGGKGHEAIIRVRLLHSMVQQRMLRVAETKGLSYFDTAKHGIPLNELDSIHAICVFCCNHMWYQLPRMGVRPTQSEIEDYIALWRYVAYIIGTPHEYFSNAQQAKAIMESISYNELAVTSASLVAGHNFVEAIKDLPPINISGSFIEAGTRWFNGNELCDQLGMGKPGWYSYTCFQGHCWLVKTLATAQRLIPAFDAWSIDFYRNALHCAIIHSKQGLQGGSTLDFKYVPQGRITGLEKNDRPDGNKMWFFQRPLELLFFIILCIGSLSILGTALLALRVLYLIVGYLVQASRPL